MLALGQPFDPGNPADRRDRRAPVRDAEVRQPLAGREHGVEVQHRLAHAHEHAVVDRLHAAEVKRLVEDLRGAQVAREAHCAGGAERARQRAARLRGHADRAPAVAVAHQHRLQRPPVGGREQRLDRAVARARLARRSSGSRTAASRASSRAARAGGSVICLVARRAPRRPRPHLARAEARLAVRGEGLVEELEVHGRDDMEGAALAGLRLVRRPLLSLQPMRLAKYLAHAGVASRRAAETLIAAGRVSVEGEVVARPRPRRRRAQAREPSTDATLSGAEARVVYALHKPVGVALDRARHPRPPDRRRARPRPALRLYPVGRLDADSSGLILLTNDGELANRLTHPRYEVPEDLPRARRGGTRSRARAAAPARAASSSRTARPRPRARAACAARGTSSSSRSAKAATARCGACARRSAIPCSSCSASPSARCALGGLEPGEHAGSASAELGGLRGAL